MGCLQENQALPKDEISAHEATQQKYVLWMLGSCSAWRRLLTFFILQTLAAEGVSCEGNQPVPADGTHAASCGLNPCGWAAIQEGCL